MADSLSEGEFVQLMKDYRDGTNTPVATIPNLSKSIITAGHLKGVAKRWNVSLWNHLRMTDSDTGRVFITPHKYMVLKLQICRLAQMQEMKRNIPESNRVIDELTGQVTGASKGAAISMPESVNVLARGSVNFLLETNAVRGGDEAANRQLEYDIATTGQGSLARAMAAGKGAKSTRTMAAYLRGQGLDTNMDKKER